MSTSSPVQKEHGHSPIAHPILEALALAPLAAGELKVVLVVIRETYGWSRKAAALSLGQLSTATGCHRNTVQRAVRVLLKEGVLLEVEPATFTGPATLALQKDPRQWGRYAVTPPALVDAPTHRPRGQSPRTGGGTVEGNRGVTVDGTTHTRQVVARAAVTEPENKGKQVTTPNGVADRPESDAQRLTNRVIELGLSGEVPDQYGRQAARAKKLLERKPLDYWLKAAAAMEHLFPFSRGDPWDVFDLGRHGSKALAAAKTGNGNGKTSQPEFLVES